MKNEDEPSVGLICFFFCIVELVWMHKYFAQIFRTRFVSRPYTRLKSAFQVNLGTLYSKTFCDRERPQPRWGPSVSLKSKVDTCTGMPKKLWERHWKHHFIAYRMSIMKRSFIKILVNISSSFKTGFTFS